ncbi:hypothetical protein DSM106972_083620 [Dulcicalothrix desertica PCC 7102]|uniref:CopG family transcriptional regulator n=1 Tax=Dulcicalothrix desertica PCC 7102 TaxID=232991 RepID=A0A3S1C6S5_9CYAN|nr:DUF1778 domain-containing protein [Dulcicalothrix desertica]RUS97625.1 hypothetical protein DSM106972_083620 [Dulcicalothrix desertica PCC 7102]TWH54835.1 uncharacterized protein DUF1778 [Dulcicalothrix desertica PCC 7102]
MKETRINVRISPEKKDALVRKAELEGKGITDVILNLIDDYLGDGSNVRVVDLAKRIEALEKKVGESVA